MRFVWGACFFTNGLLAAIHAHAGRWGFVLLAVICATICLMQMPPKGSTNV